MTWREVVGNWLGFKPTVKYQLIELPQPRTRSGWDKDTRETVATLMAHPGFIALMERLDLQSGLLRSKLLGERHQDLRSVEFLQSGIFWCNWLRQQVQGATTKTLQSRVDAQKEDEAALKELDSLLERV